jgi:predicted pyridoxine 5'-phosphate oxidase superfamily flavin-nucleotide-binding protein
MSQTEPTAELNEGFSEPGAAPRPWTEVAEILSESEMFWLATVRRDGRPHVTPLPAIWLDGILHFCCGSHEQKTKNLRSNPRCTLAVGANEFRSGLDVVVEGTAIRVTGPARLQRLAAIWKSKLDWDFKVTDDGFHDPAGRTGLVFGVKPDKILAFGKSPYSQARYRFNT